MSDKWDSIEEYSMKDLEFLLSIIDEIKDMDDLKLLEVITQQILEGRTTELECGCLLPEEV